MFDIMERNTTVVRFACDPGLQWNEMDVGQIFLMKKVEMTAFTVEM